MRRRPPRHDVPRTVPVLLLLVFSPLLGGVPLHGEPPRGGTPATETNRPDAPRSDGGPSVPLSVLEPVSVSRENASEQATDEYESRRHDLVAAVRRRGREVVPAARGHWAALGELAPDDPIPPHAFALVLAGHGRTEEAVDVLGAFVRESTGLDVDCWRTLGRLRAENGRRREALELAEWAMQRLREGGLADLDEAGFREGYRWIGRLVATIEVTAEEGFDPLAQATHRALSLRCPETYAVDYAAGRESVFERRQRVLSTPSTEATAIRARIAEKREAAEREAKRWRTWLDERLEPLDRPYTRLHDELVELRKEYASLLASIQASRGEAQQVEYLVFLSGTRAGALALEMADASPLYGGSFAPIFNRVDPDRKRLELAMRRIQLQAQQRGYLREYVQMVREVTRTATAFRRIADERARHEARYRSEMKPVERRLAVVAREEAIADEPRPALVRRRTAEAQRRALRPSTYLAVDEEDVIERLLVEAGVRP